MRNKKRDRMMLFLILLLAISVGYAAISTTLKITGTASVATNTWGIYWDVPVVTSGSVTDTVPTRTQDSNNPSNTKLVWSIELALPGDYYEFTVDVVNESSLDAMITSINNTASPTLPSYIKYTVTYADGRSIANNQLLRKATVSGNTTTPTREKYLVRVEYDSVNATSSTLNGMSGDETYTFTFNVQYGIATSDAINREKFTLPQNKTINNLALGDELCLENQCFNFIKYEGNDVVMLAKYNLKVGDNYNGTTLTAAFTKIGNYSSADSGYGLQDSQARGWVNGDTTHYGIVDFSKTNYWDNSGSPKSTYPGSYYPSVDFPYAYDPVNYAGAPGTNTYSVAYYVEQYKTKLINDYHASIKDARLLKMSEVTDPSIGCVVIPGQFSCPTTGSGVFLFNTSFWFGSVGASNMVLIILTNGALDGGGYNSSVVGVRPVIVVEKSNI